MKYEYKNGKIEMTNFDSFNIGEILECGQCFRFEKISSNLGEVAYSLIAHGRLLFISQDSGRVCFWYEDGRLLAQEFEELWMPYFDMAQDYSAIKARISQKDEILRRAIDFAPGLRLLRQDPWEIIVSFIISQNNRIPQIQKVIKNISAAFGKPIFGGNFAFPSPQELSVAKAEDLRELKAGFRDKYIVDATAAVLQGEIDTNIHSKLDTDELRQSLLRIKGIGEKVAHCILLFGYGRYETFPVDTWVRKIMEGLYFDGQKTTVADIHALARRNFGEYSGYANQYLFHYIRLNPKMIENNSKTEKIEAKENTIA